jgi:hypothetical protein
MNSNFQFPNFQLLPLQSTTSFFPGSPDILPDPPLIPFFMDMQKNNRSKAAHGIKPGALRRLPLHLFIRRTAPSPCTARPQQKKVTATALGEVNQNRTP